MAQPLAVLFDAVGTVIRPVPDVSDVYTAAGRRFGSRHDRAEVQDRFRRAFARHADHGATSEPRERARWRNIVADVFDDVTGDTDALFAHLWDHFADPAHWSLFDDVLPVWKSLREKGVVIGIASNFDERLGAICRAIHPLDQADHVFCSSAIGFPKPRPEFFAHIEHELRLAPSRILLVGDSLSNDVEAARAAGWQAIWIQRGGTSDHELAAGGLADVARLRF